MWRDFQPQRKSHCNCAFRIPVPLCSQVIGSTRFHIEKYEFSRSSSHCFTVSWNFKLYKYGASRKMDNILMDMCRILLVASFCLVGSRAESVYSAYSVSIQLNKPESPVFIYWNISRYRQEQYIWKQSVSSLQWWKRVTYYSLTRDAELPCRVTPMKAWFMLNIAMHLYCPIRFDN